jgi:hypothetical protein
MRHLLAAFCLVVALAGCGGADTSNPVAACNSGITAACNKASSCNLLGTTTVDECITAGEAAVGCSGAACPAGTTFSSSVANQCISDINNESCTNAGEEELPASCNNISAACQ